MTRPPFAYFGGKTILAPRIADLLPPHRHYVEPFAGSLAVLLAKAPSVMETVNDLDHSVVAFCRGQPRGGRAAPRPEGDRVDRAPVAGRAGAVAPDGGCGGMSVIVCGQFVVLGDACPECEASIHRVTRDGFPDQHGVRYCSEDCLADHQERVEQLRGDTHLNVRDLLCDCPDVCTPAGLPTQAMRDEYAAEQDTRGGAPNE